MNKLRYISVILVLAGCSAAQEKEYPATQPTVVFDKNSTEYKDFEDYVRMKSLVPNESVFVCGTFDDDNVADTTTKTAR